MHVTYLDPSGSQIGKKESIADTARVLSRMFDGIEYRGYGQEIVEELARYADVPVWNGLTNEFHPTQILADMLTIQEHFGSLKGKKLVYLGDARYNMGKSLMVGCAKLGMEFVACAPESYFPDKALVAQCMQIARVTDVYKRQRLPGAPVPGPPGKGDAGNSRRKAGSSGRKPAGSRPARIAGGNGLFRRFLEKAHRPGHYPRLCLLYTSRGV